MQPAFNRFLWDFATGIQPLFMGYGQGFVASYSNTGIIFNGRDIYTKAILASHVLGHGYNLREGDHNGFSPRHRETADFIFNSTKPREVERTRATGFHTGRAGYFLHIFIIFIFIT